MRLGLGCAVVAEDVVVSAVIVVVFDALEVPAADVSGAVWVIL